MQKPARSKKRNTTMGDSACTTTYPGHITLHPPNACTHPIDPRNYSCGFDRRGAIIGYNQEVPFPFENRHYHDHHFPRLVDWCRLPVKDPHKFVFPKDTLKGQEVAEYFTAENDEGYNRWAARKEAEKKHVAELKECRRIVPPEVKSLPGHVGPSNTETSAEVIGQYLDLQPRLPAVYPLPGKIQPTPLPLLVRYRRSNMSDHPPIPDHAFAVSPQEMMTTDGCCYSRGVEGAVHLPQARGSTTAPVYTFKQTQEYLGQTLGQRRHGFTWPLFTPTGLELDRPMPHKNVSVIVGSTGRAPVDMRAPARLVPKVYCRYQSYTACPGVDKDTEVNPAMRPVKLLCAPQQPYHLHGNLCPSNPCHQDFVISSNVPIPVGLQSNNYCT